MQNVTSLLRLKVLTSHAGHARFLAECSEEPVAYMARREEIPSPYAYSLVKPVYLWGETLVAIYETAHRRFEVYQVPEELVYITDAEAEAAALQGGK